MKKYKKNKKVYCKGKEYNVIGHDNTFYYTTRYQRIARDVAEVAPGVKTIIFKVDFVTKKLINKYGVLV